MAYTSAQLIAAYTAANDGVAPDAATTQLLTAFASQTQTGQLSDSAALAVVLNSADNDVNVAVQAYQFFTGKTPSKIGLDYLVNSTTNTTDLNDPYYAQFGLENRYINFAVNLGVIGDGAAGFASTYGALTFDSFVGVAYETIIGSSYAQAAGINTVAAIADIAGRKAAFEAIARQAGVINAASTPAQVDIATKAALIGYLMAEGIKADVGIYAAGANNFVNALVNGNAQYNVNLLTTYSVLGGGTGQAGGGPVPVGTTFTLTTALDTFNGSAGNDVFQAVVATTNPTLTAADTVNGGGGADTLNINVDTALANTIPVASVTGVETINLRNVSGNTQTLAAGNFAGATQFNADRSVDAVIVTGLTASTGVGVVGNGSVTNGASTFTYGGTVTTSNVTISGGTTAGAITLTGGGLTTVNVNSVGASNTIGAVTLTGNPVTALNIKADTTLSTGGFVGFTGTAAKITVTGAAAASSATGAAVALGTIENATVATIDASGLTAGGISATLSTRTDLAVTGGGGNDFITTGSVLTTGSVAAGGGTGDRLTVADSTHLATAALGAKYTGFEVLQVQDGVTVDLDNIAGITSIRINDAAGSTGVTNVTAAQSANVTLVGAAAGGTTTIALKGATDVGQIDTLTLNVNDGSATVNTLALGTPVLSGIENLKLNLTDNLTIAALTSATATNSIVVTGAGALTLTTGAIGTANMFIDASAATGVQTISAAAFTTNSIKITTGTANDVVTGSGQDDILSVGAGDDTVTGGAGADTITGGTGNDTFAIGSRADTKGATFAAADTSIANIDKITDFAGGGAAVADVIQFAGTANVFGTALDFTAGTTATVTAVTVATAADFTALAAAIQLASAGVASTNAVAQVYDVTVTAGNLAGHYVVLNDDTAGIAATDTYISIVGSAALHANDFTFTA
jgi:hypothetical protein